MTGATSIYGDGNCKVNRKVCMFPQQILQPYNNNTPYNDLKCSQSMLHGNSCRKELLTCLYHAEILVKTCLKLERINDYVQYMDLHQQWKLAAKGNNTQRQLNLKHTLQIYDTN